MSHIVGMDQRKIIDLRPGEYRTLGERLVRPFLHRQKPIHPLRWLIGLVCAGLMVYAGAYLVSYTLMGLAGLAGINLLVIGFVWLVSDLVRHPWRSVGYH